MNIMNIMSMLQGSGVVSTPKAQPATQMQAPAGLQGFLGLLFAQMGAGVQTAGGTTDFAQITEKIAALLQASPVDTTALQSLLQQALPRAPQDLLTQVSGLLQGIAAPVSEGKPALTRDLTAQLATILQQPPLENGPARPQPQSQPQPQPQITQDQVAALLNNLQPGDGTAIDSTTLQILTEAQEQVQTSDPAQAETPLDGEILSLLQEKITSLDLTNGQINKDVLVAFKNDITAFLEDQGFAPATVQKYLTALAKTLRPVPDATQPSQPSSQPSPMQSTLQDVFYTPERAADANTSVTDLRHAMQQAKQADAATQMPQPVPAQQAGAQAQNTLTTKQMPAQAAMTSHPALVNMLNAGEGGFDSSGFGQQQPGHQGASADLQAQAAALKSAGEASPQGFINYMAAARGNQTATTQMVALQIQRNAAARTETFTLQLTPTDLGELEIRLKFHKDGSMKAHLVAEKPETLALLQKDSAQLERVLQQSGLEMGDDALSFDLRQQGQQRHLEDHNSDKGDGEGFAAELNGTPSEKPAAARIAVEAYGYITQNGVNITV